MGRMAAVIVCHCSGVNDRQIRAAVRSGASTRREVARACGSAGEGCGTCMREIDALIVEERDSDERGSEMLDGGLLAAG